MAGFLDLDRYLPMGDGAIFNEDLRNKRLRFGGFSIGSGMNFIWNASPSQMDGFSLVGGLGYQAGGLTNSFGVIVGLDNSLIKGGYKPVPAFNNSFGVTVGAAATSNWSGPSGGLFAGLSYAVRKGRLR